MENNKKISIIIPVYNEEKTISKVIQDFKKELPKADIIVIDNNSSDNTVKNALESGGCILFEKKQGKGYVVRKAFNEIDADVFILVDGDDTYPANEIHKLIEPVISGRYDMVVGNRLNDFKKENKTFLHGFGNNFFVWLINLVFRSNIKDVFSGYRVFSSDFVQETPLLSTGFEIESEITVQSLERGFRVKEIPIKYRERPQGSYSKLRTFHDGWRILLAIFSIFRDYRPMAFFSLLAALFLLMGFCTGFIVIIDYLQKGIVTRVPFAILTSLLIIVSFLCFIGGFIVGAVNRRFSELNELIKKSKKICKP